MFGEWVSVWYCWFCLYHPGYRYFPDSLLDSSRESRNFFRPEILFLKIPTVCLLKKALFLLISIVEKGWLKQKSEVLRSFFSFLSSDEIDGKFFFGGREPGIEAKINSSLTGQKRLRQWHHQIEQLFSTFFIFPVVYVW